MKASVWASGPSERSSWLAFIGHTADSLWSVDLFRWESIVLRGYCVLVVMDRFTRRLVASVCAAVRSQVPTCAACSTWLSTAKVYRDASVQITIRCSKHTDGWRTCGFWSVRLLTSNAA